ADWLAPAWRMADVGALMTTRSGGVSRGRYASMNVGVAVGDDAGDVAANRRVLAEAIAASPVFLRQVHGARVVRIDAGSAGAEVQDADASWTDVPGVACAVLVSDCLPVLLAAPQARAVGAAHAGWRGLSAGVVQRCADAVCAGASCEPRELVAWLGPCIGPDAFEVGPDVPVAFGVEPTRGDLPRFRYAPRRDGDPRWRADLAGLARDRLAAIGVHRVSGGSWCTVQDRSRFFSFRRDGITGRMAAAVWIRP
ncbi:MAG TPA: peptidoglycan editing factor PgeF, partial [Burkholderiaceae bacterium]|nr:peptidoglycan editing factor PgeF [Burkholderiaceae bacterium]